MTANNEQWEICFVGTAGKCDAELDWSMDWSMDLADGAGNGSVGKPRIRAMKALQNLSQAIQECARYFIQQASEYGGPLRRSSRLGKQR